ncbi:energy transducer TonB [Salinicola sp. JS01]|uniref:energy transducer TonB n=1 Tax=Salinicola sp. JS01 TaxID=3050071 RepID=UPI00255B5936|nr:energy transducer TonB [Salinicola sp. JS01]WIX34503.1 energy transducer TonB [Salinicola sp. JS01]
MRRLVGLVAGGVLALVLFYLLALLVAPPAPEDQEIVSAAPIAMVDAPEQAQTAPATSAAAPPPPPAAPPPPPAAAPTPAPTPSQIAVPEPEVAQPQTPAPTLDTSLPELSEARPTPRPKPQPQPQPQPESRPEPNPQPSPSPAPSQAQGQAAQPTPKGTQAAPRDVGQLQPTSRVNPTYPVRAQRRGLEGYVEVSFVIQPDGRVDSGSLRVIDAEPANVFDRAVEEAVARWRFPPADDVRRATQRIEFKLQG